MTRQRICNSQEATISCPSVFPSRLEYERAAVYHHAAGGSVVCHAAERGKCMTPATIKLHVIEGGLRGQEFVFDGPAQCTIGRATDCDIRLPVQEGQMEVSRRHCLLEIDPPAARVRDLGSLNGTYVNGAKIGQRRPAQPPEGADPGPAADRELHDGDEILVGHNRLRVEMTGIAVPGEEAVAPAFAG